MALKKYEEADIASIASTIREKTGESKTYKVSQMDEGVNEVYEAGKKAEHDAFWNVYVHPSAVDLDYMFAGQRWTNNLFTPPPITLKPQRAMYLFARSGMTGDFAQICKDAGFAIDFSKSIYVNQIFNNSKFTRIGELDFSGAKSGSNAIFINASVLVTIDKITVGENTSDYTNWFSGCYKLANVTFDGVIDKNISFKDCQKLTRASIESIYAHLMPDTEFTVTFSKTAIGKAFETSEGANDGSTSPEWEELISRLPYITFSLI